MRSDVTAACRWLVQCTSQPEANARASEKDGSFDFDWKSEPKESDTDPRGPAVGGGASLAVAVGTKGAASSDSRIAVVTLSIVWMATVASVSSALQRLRSEVQAAKVPRINGDAMVRCRCIAIGFFKVVVEIPYWRGGFLPPEPSNACGFLCVIEIVESATLSGVVSPPPAKPPPTTCI